MERWRRPGTPGALYDSTPGVVKSYEELQLPLSTSADSCSCCRCSPNANRTAVTATQDRIKAANPHVKCGSAPCLLFSKASSRCAAMAPLERVPQCKRLHTQARAPARCAETVCSAVNQSLVLCISAGTRRASITALLFWMCAASTPPRPGKR